MNKTRKASRHASALTANLHAARGEAGTPVTVRDISMQGCQLEHANGSKVGRSCELYFDWRGSLVGVEARVVWCDSRGRVGLKYEKVDEYSRRSLQDLCTALQSQGQSGRRAGEVKPSKPTPVATQSYTTEHPLFPTKGAAAGTESGRSRRVLPRYISELRGDVKDSATGRSAGVSLVDLSVSGARLEGAGLPEAGRACQLHTEWEGREMVLAGEVAWKTQKQIGLKFSPLDDQTMRQLRQVCASSYLAPSGPPI